MTAFAQAVGREPVPKTVEPVKLAAAIQNAARALWIAAARLGARS